MKPFLQPDDEVTVADMLARGACLEGVREFVGRTGLYSGRVKEAWAVADRCTELEALDGYGYGYGSGYANASGDGDGYGDSYGGGDGYGDGYGYGGGFGSGFGYGGGNGSGFGCGNGYGSGYDSSVDLDRLA